LSIPAKAVDWDRLDEMFSKTFRPDNGRPAISTLLMVTLQYLKYTFDLSDDDVVAAWVASLPANKETTITDFTIAENFPRSEIEFDARLSQPPLQTV
jgi:hypothetical protein